MQKPYEESYERAKLGPQPGEAKGSSGAVRNVFLSYSASS